MQNPKYSVIIPVYNRPHEVWELLESLTRQTYKNFEILLVEDGSEKTSREVYEQYASKLSIAYYFKPNSGPGPSRNFGFERARGEYFVVFDSDCVIPETYFTAVENFMLTEKVDAWGGPDRGRDDFTPLQRAMGYTMASVLTTGGIRGGKKRGFQPRSFNMGISRAVYNQTNGFSFDRYAEDIELSVRMRKHGFNVALISDAFVYHKRRTTLHDFFKQVSNFGKGRVLVGRTHPGEIKLTHWFPVCFLLGMCAVPIMILFFPMPGMMLLTGYGSYFLIIAIHAFITLKSVSVALLSVPSAFVQLTGYGVGFLKQMFGR
ncbi:MAG TPA: glycosyltransferase [Cyclobacteriaceae bacterium]|jgi:glycosyltransferase involved in cell wall biosynthesis|nr:glycosyltransferase [Cytophagales bacterium]HNT49600.1 glycosyltransferase [Cyclobacteriaceae bacterium]HRE66549.1 glycosyltransferase [Cyclobacteriaceae bacterium]HRF31917.1 glycosyltransferase [Cyclobacteriaceae bacterium]